MSIKDSFSYNAGASGTVTVPSGKFVTGFSCHVASGGAAGSLVITPDGPDVGSPTAGDSIPIPAGTSLSVAAPAIPLNQNAVGPGSTLVFTGTDSYVVTYTDFGG